MQTLFPLDDGSALKLTIAKYYTPSHKVIHEHGITPDILLPVTDLEEAALMLQRTPGGLDSLPDRERRRLQSLPDEQLQRANALLQDLARYDQLLAPANRPKVATQ